MGIKIISNTAIYDNGKQAVSTLAAERQLPPDELEKRLHPTELAIAYVFLPEFLKKEDWLQKRLSDHGYCCAYERKETWPLSILTLGLVRRVSVKAQKEICPEGAEGAPSYGVAYEQLKSLRARERQLQLSGKNETETGCDEYIKIVGRKGGLQNSIGNEAYQMILSRVKQEEPKPSLDYILDEQVAIIDELLHDLENKSPGRAEYEAKIAALPTLLPSIKRVLKYDVWKEMELALLKENIEECRAVIEAELGRCWTDLRTEEETRQKNRSLADFFVKAEGDLVIDYDDGKLNISVLDKRLSEMLLGLIEAEQVFETRAFSLDYISPTSIAILYKRASDECGKFRHEIKKEVPKRVANLKSANPEMPRKEIKRMKAEFEENAIKDTLNALVKIADDARKVYLRETDETSELFELRKKAVTIAYEKLRQKLEGRGMPLGITESEFDNWLAELEKAGVNDKENECRNRFYANGGLSVLPGYIVDSKEVIERVREKLADYFIRKREEAKELEAIILGEAKEQSAKTVSEAEEVKVPAPESLPEAPPQIPTPPVDREKETIQATAPADSVQPKEEARQKSLAEVAQEIEQENPKHESPKFKVDLEALTKKAIEIIAEKDLIKYVLGVIHRRAKYTIEGITVEGERKLSLDDPLLPEKFRRVIEQKEEIGWERAVEQLDSYMETFDNYHAYFASAFAEHCIKKVLFRKMTPEMAREQAHKSALGALQQSSIVTQQGEGWSPEELNKWYTSVYSQLKSKVEATDKGLLVEIKKQAPKFKKPVPEKEEPKLTQEQPMPEPTAQEEPIPVQEETSTKEDPLEDLRRFEEEQRKAQEEHRAQEEEPKPTPKKAEEEPAAEAPSAPEKQETMPAPEEQKDDSAKTWQDRIEGEAQGIDNS